MKKINAGLLFVLSVALVFVYSSNYSSAQKKSAKKAESSRSVSSSARDVIATVGKEVITYSDLEKAFRKNMNRKDARLGSVSRDSITDFLNLYINYRLKVNDALSRNFDKDSSVIADINQNRRILAESYFYDKKLVDPAVNRMLAMRDHEMQIAIIMIALPPGQNPDTTQAYRKAKNTLDLIKSGKNFSDLARDSSDDKESSNKGGVVNIYITAGSVQRPIENAIYSLKPGQVYPEPVSTRYGYFIVKLLRDEPRVKIKASQILIAEGEGKDSLYVEKKADSLLNLIKKGADFGKLAEENSEDPASAMKNGNLGAWYSRSSGFEANGKHLVPDFENALFSLKDGEISGKVYTEYGIHIIRRDSTKKFDINAEREDLKKLYKRLYYEPDKRILLDSLRLAYGFKLDDQNMSALVAAVDSTKSNLDSAWTRHITTDMNKKVLYKFNKQDMTIGNFVEYMNKKTELRGMGLNREGFKRAIDKMVDPQVFDIASANLENEYPEFSALMKEFRDGILLFRVEALEVWDKLKFDSTLAREFYNSSKTKYQTSPAYDITEIYVLSDSTAKDVYQRAAKGEDFEKLAQEFTQRANFREKSGKWGKVSVKDNKLAQIVQSQNAKVGSILEPQPYEKGFSVIKVNAFEPSRQKTFEEAIPDFAPEFQDMMQKKLTETWLGKIKAQFPVQIQTSELDKALSDNNK